MIEFITENWEVILTIVTAVVTAASAIANVTPTKTDNKIVGVIQKVVSALALNFKVK